MLSAYVEQGQGKEALMLYRQMLEVGERPTELTFVSALQACSIREGQEESSAKALSRKLATLEIVQALHADARKERAVHVSLGNTLVSMYGKYGTLSEAQNMFMSMTQRDVVSWNA
eukprot:c11690_g1_i1 orf=3-347(-)